MPHPYEDDHFYETDEEYPIPALFRALGNSTVRNVPDRDMVTFKMQFAQDAADRLGGGLTASSILDLIHTSPNWARDFANYVRAQKGVTVE